MNSLIPEQYRRPDEIPIIFCEKSLLSLSFFLGRVCVLISVGVKRNHHSQNEDREVSVSSF